MEEKERYEVISPSLNGYAYIHDFKTDNVLNTYDSCDLLNQQDKQIKELEEQENQQLKQQLAEYEKEIEKLNACVDFYKSYYISFKEKVIDELEKVKEKALHFYVNDTPKLTGFYIDINEIDNQIAELTHQHEDKGE